ncbi:hypothetical protein KWH45_04195 [Xanthomonas campestris pv. mirabilis]|uniref:hypothetical protein n=1 Tax=Xanthomonas euvesicatoria TaxID=456327 RepID=UPI001C47FB49|nr:hypothetical protein [Xanthomonas euvesicatoria]MBV6852650.1 hypothetical protein [Xanthomonas campestris pv. mirabilis]
MPSSAGRSTAATALFCVRTTIQEDGSYQAFRETSGTRCEISVGFSSALAQRGQQIARRVDGSTPIPDAVLHARLSHG